MFYGLRAETKQCKYNEISKQMIKGMGCVLLFHVSRLTVVSELFESRQINALDRLLSCFSFLIHMFINFLSSTAGNSIE
jgi:hypothetical protein